MDLLPGGTSAIRRLAFLALTAFLLAQEVVFPPVQRYFELPHLGRESLSLNLYQANIFEKKRDYYLDFEETRLTLSLSLPLSELTRIYLYVPFVYVSGGLMDGLIDGFHRFFGFPDGGRRGVPYGRVTYLLFSEDLASRGPAIAEPEVFLSYGRAFQLIVGSKVPLRKDGFRSGGPWGFVGASLKGKAGEVLLKSSLGIAQGEGRFFLSRFEGTWRRFDFGFLLRTSPYSEGDISHPATAVFLSIRVMEGVKLGFVEDLAPYDTSADFTLYLSFSR